MHRIVVKMSDFPTECFLNPASPKTLLYFQCSLRSIFIVSRRDFNYFHFHSVRSQKLDCRNRLLQADTVGVVSEPCVDGRYLY